MSLRWKLTLALGLVAAAVTLAVGLASYRATQQRLVEEIDRSIVQVRQVALRDPDGDHMPRSNGDAPMGMPGRPLGVEQFLVQVLDGSGAVVRSSYGVELPVDGTETAIAVSGDGARLRSAYAQVGDTQLHVRMATVAVSGGGAVQVARDLSETDSVLDDLRTRTAWLVVLVAAVGALIGWIVASSITRSLTRLTGAASEVAATGRLDVPVPVSGRDEVGRLGTAFNTMLSALQRSRDQQKRLVQDAGHELRTPLTSLRTNIDVLRRHETMPTEMRQQVLDDLDAEAGQLAALVEEVVELATDRREDEPVVDVELADLIRSVVERVERRTGREMRLDLDGTRVRGRPAALERAVGNLLDNAAKFDGSGQPIEVSLRAGRLEVRDHGPGIAADDLPMVWERFHRAPDARQLPGSGLGLAIVDEIVAAHGGSVFAGNHPDGGALVGFVLPLAGSA